MFKIIFNGLAILFASVSMWQIFSLKSKIEEDQALIRGNLEERDKLVQQKDAVNKEHAQRYSRERVKNKQLEDEKFEASLEESNQKKAKDESVSVIEDLENSISENEKSIESLKLQLIKEKKEYDELVEAHETTLASLPAMEARKDDLLNGTRNLEDEIQMLKSSLENYESVTNRLKEHYDQTTASLFNDKTSRNWLEAGEHIRLSSMEVDLNNGLIGLPVGQEDGVLKDKLFAIRSQGQEICKVKITHSDLNHAVASIIPLLGKPAKLLELSEFQLYHL